MAVVVATILLLGIGFAGIGIKLLLKKDGKFSGTCASNSPFLNKEGQACGFCGAMPEEQCKKPGEAA
ncbi:MAG: membrane or secreted protein [Flavobacteriales bacterium]|nr:membrane or secreted protein [Flavobacteriales bacterium]